MSKKRIKTKENVGILGSDVRKTRGDGVSQIQRLVEENPASPLRGSTFTSADKITMQRSAIWLRNRGYVVEMTTIWEGYPEALLVTPPYGSEVACVAYRTRDGRYRVDRLIPSGSSGRTFLELSAALHAIYMPAELRGGERLRPLDRRAVRNWQDRWRGLRVTIQTRRDHPDYLEAVTVSLPNSGGEELLAFRNEDDQVAVLDFRPDDACPVEGEFPTMTRALKAIEDAICPAIFQAFAEAAS